MHGQIVVYYSVYACDSCYKLLQFFIKNTWLALAKCRIL